MSNIVPMRATGALTRNDPRRLKLFTSTVGKELVGPEIDEALEWCQIYGANPFTRDIYFFVFDADNPSKRRVVPVLAIGLYRKIAARAGNYRPDPAAPRFIYSDAAKSECNPTGMVSCEVSVYRHSHGEWYPITSCLKWEERAPINEVWAPGDDGKRRPSGKFVLDPRKTNWRTMPETMMAKCTEADAIRKGWPAETAGSYVQEEMDAPKTIELTATEIVANVERDERAARLGGPAVIVDWCDGKELARVTVGKFGDAALQWIAANKEAPLAIKVWEERNRYVLREYWAHDAAGALEVKKAVEAASAVQEV